MTTETEPTCRHCGKPSGISRGKPRVFCAPPDKTRRSPCSRAYHEAHRSPETMVTRKKKDAERKRKSWERERLDPEMVARRNAYQREWLNRNPEKKAAKYRKEAGRIRDQYAKRRAQGLPADPRSKMTLAQYEAVKQERYAVIRARKAAEAKSRAERASRPTGSVLITAAPSPARDTLLEITRLISGHYEPPTREEIVAQAALLHLEGLDLTAAVAQATREVRRSAAPFRNTVPLHDCHWI